MNLFIFLFFYEKIIFIFYLNNLVTDFENNTKFLELTRQLTQQVSWINQTTD